MFQALNQSNLTYEVAVHMINCSQNQQCQQLFTTSANFVNIVTKIFARPFPQLGTMITFFAANVFTDNGFDYEMNMIEEKSHNFLAALLREYYPNENFTVSLYDLYAWGSFHQSLFNKPKYSLLQSECTWDQYYKIYYLYLDYTDNKEVQFPCADNKNPCCNLLTKYLIGNHLEQFMKMMKYSQINNDFMNQIDSAFLSKFIDNSKLFKKYNLTLVSAENKDMGMILFCDMQPDLGEVLKRYPVCSKFSPVSTSQGICQSFNELPSTDIYENLPYLQVWNSVFGMNNPNSSLIYPKGFGASKGMYLILNSYESFKSQRTSNDFILSITNEDNVYDITRNSFTLLPGNIYTFRILASQTRTTAKFETMSRQDRKCALPNEKGKLKFMKNYSMSGCEYECALERAAEKCYCIPWNLPRLSMDDPPFCDMLGNLCFYGVMKAPATFDDCDCPTDCRSTTLSVFESSRQMDDLKEFCDPGNAFYFEFKNFINKQHFGLRYNHIVNGGPNPDEYDTICRYLLQNHVTIVKVEMATKSIIRSLRDKKFSFENQLSTLGK